MILGMMFGFAQAGQVEVVATEPNAVVVEVTAFDLSRQVVVINGENIDRVDVPGWVHWQEIGAPAVPVRGAVLGVPFGAQLVATVIDADYEEMQGVDLMPVPDTQWLGSDDYPIAREIYEKDLDVYRTDAFYPNEEAVIVQEGTMRDQRVATLSLRPVQYNPVRKVLRVARRLRVRVAFVRGADRPAVRPRMGLGRDGFEPIYEKGLLNATQARAWRGQSVQPRQKQALDWYDTNARYYKIGIVEDGIYRLDANWFSTSNIGLGTGDLERLKMYVDGREIPLLVEDGGDGKLDAGDGVFFWGQYRRAPDRDFVNEFGRTRMYWLTVDGGLTITF